MNPNCIACGQHIPPNARCRLCFDCWRAFGSPKSRHEFSLWLIDHPNAAVALARKLDQTDGVPDGTSDGTQLS
jgi:hypothetical protein